MFFAMGPLLTSRRGHCSLLVKVWTLPNAAIRQSKDNRRQPVWLSRLFTDKSDCVFNLGERPATK
jgi:hypothetical protein